MTNKEKHDHEFMARFYDLVFGPLLRDVRKKIIDVSKINEQDSVLEVACGTGEQALLYAKRGAVITGLDLSKDMLAVANKKRGTYPLKFLQGDATSLPFEDNQFNLTTITLALHEMTPDIRDEVVEEMRRVTKKDGRIIITDYTKPQSRSFAGYFNGFVIWTVERLAGGYHYKNFRQFMETGGLYALIKEHNFTIQKTSSCYGDNLGILSLKK